MSLLKYLLKEININSNEIYHFTDVYALVYIIKDNKLKAQVPQDTIDFKDEYPEGYDFKRISLTTLDHWQIEYINVKLFLDFNKLKSNYNIEKFSEPDFEDEEEYIVREDINNLSNYIIKTEILNENYSRMYLEKNKETFYEQVKELGLSKSDISKFNVEWVKKFK